MSRATRWAEALESLAGIDAGDLEALKDEYEEWRGNVPENLEDTPVVEKLDAAVEAAEEILEAVEDLKAALESAEGVELPLGFGRD